MDFSPTRSAASISLQFCQLPVCVNTQTLQRQDEAEQLKKASDLIRENRPDEAFFIAQELAEKNNNSDAQNLLGDMYFCGIGIEQDCGAAIKYYEQAANQGNASSLNRIGYALQYGLKETQELKLKPHEAMTHYMEALIAIRRANEGNTDFIEGVLQNLMKGEEFTIDVYNSGEHMTLHSYFLHMAVSYEYSNPPDLLTAFAIIKNACLLKGEKPAPSDAQTLNELQKKILDSAKADLTNCDYLTAYKKLFFLGKDTHVTAENQAIALGLLGNMYLKGGGVAQNVRQAIIYLNLPASHGDKQACYLLGKIYSSDTTHSDADTSMYWYEKAGMLNSGQAHYRMGQVFLRNKLGIEQSTEKAQEQFNLAIKYKYFEAYAPLAGLYSTHDPELALTLYQKSKPSPEIEQKIDALTSRLYNDAMNCFRNQDENSAISKLAFLAGHSHAKALNTLGEIMLKKGLDCTSSQEAHLCFKEAFNYFQKAIDHRHQPAYFRAGQALEKMGCPLFESQQAHNQQVLAFYETASHSKDPETNHEGQASFAIATILNRSTENKDKLKLIAGDEEKKSYLERAHEQGHTKALETMFTFSKRYLEQYENAFWPLQNKVDLDVGTKLFKLALDYKYPQAIEEHEKNREKQFEQNERVKFDKQIAEMNKQRAELDKQAEQEKLQKEKEQKDKEWDEMVSSAVSNASEWISTLGSLITPDPAKSLKNPLKALSERKVGDHIEDKDL